MINFAAIFQNQSDIRSLLNGGSKFGVNISKYGGVLCYGNVVNIGTVIVEDLHYHTDSVPKGYEDQNHSESFKSFCQNITISWISNSITAVHLGIQCLNSFIKIKGYQIFSCESALDSNPTVSIENFDDRDNDTVSGDIFNKLTIDSAVNLTLKYKIREDYDGNLHRFIVFQLELHESIDSFSHRITTFHVGLMVIGSVIRAGIKSAVTLPIGDNKSQHLSVEAKPFIPISSATFFDTPCHVECLQNYSKHLVGLSIPTRFGNVIASIPPNVFSIVTPSMVALYLLAYRENALERVIIGFELHTTMFKFTANEYSSSALVNQKTPQQHLYTIGKLIILEEFQRSVDITEFDMLCVTLSFEMCSIPSSSDPAVQAAFNNQGQKVVRTKLKIVGSSENRPMVSLGDVVRLRPVQESASYLGVFGAVELQGIVVSYKLSSEEAVCEFPLPRNWTVELLSSIKYHIRFSFERCGFLFVHQALQIALNNAAFNEALFPTEETYGNYKTILSTAMAESSYSLFLGDPGAQRSAIEQLRDDSAVPPAASLSHENKTYTTRAGIIDTKLNLQQLEVVNSITAVSQCLATRLIVHTPLPPLIIYGPPGTGKTSAVIESILQISINNPSLRILACAPSDAAADVLALRLVAHFSKAKMFRLNWWQRLLASLPAQLLPYSYQEGNLFELPPVDTLKSFQVIVSTCGAAGSLMNMVYATDGQNMKYRGDLLPFDVVFIDEASQGSEAETIVPLSLCRPGGLMVLSGDPNQLGPITRSPIHRLCGTEGLLSLQERLLRSPVYVNNSSQYRTSAAFLLRSQENGGSVELAPPLVFVLFKNYRSHAKILETPSKLFYDGLLEECGDRATLDKLQGWDMLPKSYNNDGTPIHFPLLMVGVDGQHQHDYNSPSFYNLQEIGEVIRVCESLAKTVRPKHIGVIAAYRQQVLRLRLALREVNLSSVNVGSVEDFQGQEIPVVVISTVLSSLPHAYIQQSIRSKQHQQHNHNGLLAASQSTALGLIGDRRRFNVAITRGMSLCVIVGNPNVLYLDSHWRELIEYIDSHDSCIGHPCYLLKRHRKEEEEANLLLSESSSFSARAYHTVAEKYGHASSTEDTVLGRLFGSHYDLEWRNLI